MSRVAPPAWRFAPPRLARPRVGDATGGVECALLRAAMWSERGKGDVVLEAEPTRWLDASRRILATARAVASEEIEGPSRGLASAELSRAALHAALLARSPELAGAPPADLWGKHASFLSTAGLSPPALEGCAAGFAHAGSLAGGRFDHALAADLALLARGAIDDLLWPERRRRAHVARRRIRGALWVVLALALVSLVLGVASYRRDLLAGKSSRTSSLHGKFDGSQMAFHTAQEDGPWIEFDLGAATEVSALTVKNRTDCCKDRAVPLVAEVSDDAVSWREVARRAHAFEVWEPTFSTVKVRYLRLTVPRRTSLHLRRVQAHP